MRFFQKTVAILEIYASVICKILATGVGWGWVSTGQKSGSLKTIAYD